MRSKSAAQTAAVPSAGRAHHPALAVLDKPLWTPFNWILLALIMFMIFEGAAGLQIDYCASGSGYVKAYDGEGSQEVMLADWNSVHPDVIARDRGLKRSAASLYAL